MVLPSVREGWGIAVLEAAALGTPTVAYRDAGGTAESVVDGTTGALVTDEASLRKVTDELLGDPRRLPLRPCHRPVSDGENESAEIVHGTAKKHPNRR